MARDVVAALQLEVADALKVWLADTNATVREVSDLEWSADDHPTPLPLPCVVVSVDGTIDPDNQESGLFRCSVSLMLTSSMVQDKGPTAHYDLRSSLLDFCKDDVLAYERVGLSISEEPGNPYWSAVSLDMMVAG